LPVLKLITQPILVLDTKPVLTLGTPMATLTVGDSAPVLTGSVSANLTGAALELHILRPDGTTVTRSASIVSAPAGTWSATLGTTTLNQPGRYFVEVQVTYSDTTIQTFATDAYDQPISFNVRQQIA
jgi:hypothetical protein